MHSIMSIEKNTVLCRSLPLIKLHSPQFQLPIVNGNPKIIMENSRNKQFVSFKLCTILGSTIDITPSCSVCLGSPSSTLSSLSDPESPSADDPPSTHHQFCSSPQQCYKVSVFPAHHTLTFINSVTTKRASIVQRRYFERDHSHITFTIACYNCFILNYC